MNIRKLIEVSRRYGADPDMVLAGGGNTSYKDENVLTVKASGHSLADIDASGFASLSRAKLAAIWSKTYAADDDVREAAVLQDLMDARLPGEESKRPSVETLLHDILPHRWVVHTHPALVNGLSCSQGGETLCREIFGNSVYWIALVKPGFILADRVRHELGLDRIDSGPSGGKTAGGKNLAKTKVKNARHFVIILQNHGIFVSAESRTRIDRLYARILKKLAKHVETSRKTIRKMTRKPSTIMEWPELAEDTRHVFPGLVEEDWRWHRIADFVATVEPQNQTTFKKTPILCYFCRSRETFEPISSAYTPDHIVYHGAKPLWLEDASEIEAAWKARVAAGGKAPRIIALKEWGVFFTAPQGKPVVNAIALFEDTVKIAAYSRHFGGHRFMDPEMIAFIENWEVEKYRAKVSGT